MTISTQHVVSSIAGWENAAIQNLPGGSSNRTWLLSQGGRRAVLKIDTTSRPSPCNSRSAEQKIQSSAAAAGCANRVIYASATAYLTEYVEGTVWNATDLQNSANLVRLAALLRRVHELPLTGRVADPVSAAAGYRQAIGTGDAAIAEHCLDTVKQTPPPRRLRCCHNDLVAGNMIATPALLLLDWEYACDNEPLFDLATVVAHHDLSPEQSSCLLDTYFDGNSVRWRERLGQQLRLYNALTWLWYGSREDADPAQLAIYESRLA